MNLKSIFQNRNLTFLWLGQMISQSGDSIFQIGLIWLVLELSGSESVTGLVAMASYLPAVLLSLFAGLAADRFDRRRIMLTADAARAIIILAIPLAASRGALSPTALGIVAFFLAIAATFFNPARDSLIPAIVPARGLLRANSLIQTSWQFSLLLGPAAAGLLLHFVGNVHLFTVDSLAYFTSFIFIFLIRNHHTQPDKFSNHTKKPNLEQRKTGLREISEGLVWAFKHPVVMPLLLITIADNLFIMGPAIVGTPVLVRKELDLGAEAYALIQACYAVGMLIGTAALLTYGERFNKGRILLLGMILDGLTFIPIFFIHTIGALAMVIIIHSLAIPMLTVTRASLIQSIVPVKMTGRIFALVNLAVVGMSALSSGLSGMALEAYGARWVFMVIGTGGAVCGVAGWLFAKKLRESE